MSKTVTEYEYDAEGNVVKETVTEVLDVPLSRHCSGCSCWSKSYPYPVGYPNPYPVRPTWVSGTPIITGTGTNIY